MARTSGENCQLSAKMIPYYCVIRGASILFASKNANGKRHTLSKKTHTHIGLNEKLRSAAWRALDTRAVAQARKLGIDDKRIAIVCRRGHGFADSPSYIANALNRLYPGIYDMVVLAYEKPTNLPSYVRFVAADTRDALCELARSRLWIANVRTNWPINKASGQIYLQTWHASMGPKLSEARVADKFPEGYVPMAKRDGSFTDFMFANDNIHAEAFAHEYWQTGPVLRCGVPRNRPLVHFDETAAYNLREKLDVSNEEGLLLYAPTFRNTADLKTHELSLHACAETLEQRFGCPFKVAFRLHAEVAGKGLPGFLQGCINVTDYPETQELLCASDVLITDYSSILEDFLLLGRPCFTFAPDLQSYEEERGFYYPLQKRPAPLATTEEELQAAIAAYNHADFLNKRDEFFSWLDATEDGNGDETIAQVIHALMPQGTTVDTAISQCNKAGVFSAISKLRGKAPQAQNPLGSLRL